MMIHQKVPKIVVIGVPALDQVAHIPFFPEEGGHVSGSDMMVVPGGPACNIATAIQRLGGAAQLLGKVGDDYFGEVVINSLRKEGVKVSNTMVVPDHFTVIVLVLIEKDGQGEQRSFSFNLLQHGDKGSLMEEEIDQIVDPGLRGIFLDGILAFFQSFTDASIKLVKQLQEKANHPLVACDPNLRIPGQKLPPDLRRRVDSLLQVSHIILLNRFEAKVLTGCHDPMDASYQLLHKYDKAHTVVVKLGGEGAHFRQKTREEDLIINLPAYSVDFVDASGAGDAFGSAFLLATLEGSSLEEAGRLATAAGALATTEKGAWIAMPNRRDCDRLVGRGLKVDG